MHVRGLMNMQYAIENGKVFVLEANPRASRTVPLVSKVCNIRMVPLATDIITSEITGRPSPVPSLKEQVIPNYGVKEAVFPFNKPSSANTLGAAQIAAIYLPAS